jgi:hypothetical protein
MTSSALAQNLRQDLYVTDGTVFTAAASGNTLYLGGSFNQVGPPTGSGVPINGSTGQAASPFAKVAGGSVNAVISDGAGGWFIGGSFTAVNQIPRMGLAHVLSDGTVASWNPVANGPVDALALDHGTVYIGGEFTNVFGVARNHLASIDSATGRATTWNPNADFPVRALAVRAAIVYVGGDFLNVGGQPRTFLAALYTYNNLASPWDAHADGNVRALVLGDTTIYVGGIFANAG